MLYALIDGELIDRDFCDRPLQPIAVTLPEWARWRARALATKIWQAAASDARLLEGFRTIATENLSHIGR